MKRKISVSLGLLGLVAALAVVPAQAKAFFPSADTAVSATRTKESTRLRRKGQGSGGQRQNAARKQTGLNSRERVTRRAVDGSGGFCTNPDCTQDRANCVPAQNGTECRNPDGTRLPRRDGTGCPRR
ncbi:MAG: hypothetical protein QM270_10485 [Bacillota bacterium]|nr:hypothetical protein [Bacillota bacterium]